MIEEYFNNTTLTQEQIDLLDAATRLRKGAYVSDLCDEYPHLSLSDMVGLCSELVEYDEAHGYIQKPKGSVLDDIFNSWCDIFSKPNHGGDL